VTIIANKATISKKNERLLHTKSGNRCAKCNIVLVERSVCVGENAHIYGEKPDAARYDASKSEAYVNSEQNLIFLCCNCHKTVDTEVLLFPVDVLFSMKTEHEKKVVHALQQGSIDYTYAELQVITTFLVQEMGKVEGNIDYQLLRLPDKIRKNQLSDVQGYIDMGLLSVSRIEDYLNRHPDPSFADKLTSIFVGEYTSLKCDDNEPISIFNALWDFACDGHVDYKYRSAGLAILVYFFEKCEVFEK
jgi:hypothetical protein